MNLLLPGAVLVFSCSAWAQPQPELSGADRDFALAAASSSLAERELGRLAMKSGMNKEVRELGALLVAENERLGATLAGVVAPFGLRLPTAADQSRQLELSHLARQLGSAFDSQFAAQALAAHQRLLTLFRAQARSEQRTELSAFAALALPDLELHLSRVQALAAPRTWNAAR